MYNEVDIEKEKKKTDVKPGEKEGQQLKHGRCKR